MTSQDHQHSGIRHKKKPVQHQMDGLSMNGQPKEGSTRFLFAQYWPIYLSLIGILAAYLLILPNNLSSRPYAADGGDFVSAVLTHGVPHPSGYPLYLMVSEVFLLAGKSQPVSTMALMSSLFTLLLLGLVAIVLLRVLQQKPEKVWIIAVILLTLGLSTLLWSQAVIVEVYTLSYVSIPIYLMWEIQAQSHLTDKTSITRWTVLSWVAGLFLGSHLTYMFLLPPVILRLWKLNRARTITIRRCMLVGAGWFSGILLYLWIPFRAAHAPAINWGNAVDLSGLWWLVSGGGYAPLMFSVQPMEYLARLSSLLRLGLGDFTIPGVVLLVYAASKRRIRFSLLPQCLYIITIYGLFSIGYRSNDSFTYLIPVWVSFGVILSVVLQDMVSVMFRGSRVFPWLMICILGALLIQAPDRITKVDPRDYTVANETKEMLLLSPPNTSLYPEGDAQTFALWYFRYGLGLREDVEIISPGLLQYEWYRDMLEHNSGQ